MKHLIYIREKNFKKNQNVDCLFFKSLRVVLTDYQALCEEKSGVNSRGTSFLLKVRMY